MRQVLVIQLQWGRSSPPGRYKLGTLHVTVQGLVSVFLIPISTTPDIPSFGTGFGTSCDASDFANTEVLGVDFVDNCSPPYTRDDVKATTWGKIKLTYR